MTYTDQRLFPGQWFLERADSPSHKADVLSRDNDEEVMRTRFDYAASMLKSGQIVVLFNPQMEIVLQKSFDKEVPAK